MADEAKPRTCINVLVTIDPAPRLARDDFNLSARALTDGFSVEQPVVVGQYPRNGGQSLTIMVRVFPSPPPPVEPQHAGQWRRVPVPARDGWPESPAEFGRAIRQARTEAGISQAQLAKRTGLSEMTIRNIEHGGVANPSSRKRLITALTKATEPATPADSPSSNGESPASQADDND